MNLYYKILQPVALARTELPGGVALAVCSRADVPTATDYLDAYKVMKEPGKYPKKYFNLDLSQDGKLRVPIILPFHYEGYAGLYQDRKLIAEGKLKHLFEDVHYTGGMLIMDAFKPKDNKLSITTLFSKVDNSSPAAASSSVVSTTLVPPQRAISTESGNDLNIPVTDRDVKKRSNATSTLPLPPAKKPNTKDAPEIAVPKPGSFM
jgi:hypothetical protein